MSRFNLFNSVPVRKHKRNKFNLSYRSSFTADFGTIYPCMVKESNAGDIWRVSTESFVRTQPLRAPAFMSADVSYHYFFVPFRLVYEDWSKFIVRGRDGDTDYDKPYATLEQAYYLAGSSADWLLNNSLADYLNFPTFSSANDVPVVDVEGKVVRIDMMPFNAYNLIYNEYYRDENLIPEVFIYDQSGMTDNMNDFADYIDELGEEYGIDGPTAITLSSPLLLRRRAWRKDYFTSALPFVQKGPQISLAGSVSGEGGAVNIVAKWSTGLPVTGTDDWFVQARHTGDPSNEVTLNIHSNTDAWNGGDPSGHRHAPEYVSDVYNIPLNAIVPIDSLQSGIMTISDLRVGLALQQWFELNARTGSDRYFEYLLGHFGVRDRDSRMQRPEYLGGFTHSIQISEVEQTSETSTTPQGNLAGRGLGFSVNTPITYRAPEPGFVMEMCSIRPHTPYYLGMPRMYQRWDAFDYYDPLFDHLSEQAIKVSELDFDYSYTPFSKDDDDFGYTPRFSEYRTSLDEIHGDFRGDLSYWVSPRSLTTHSLDRDFIEINPYLQKLNEMFAFIGTSDDPAPHFLVHLVQHVSVIRIMSKFATPKL